MPTSDLCKIAGPLHIVTTTNLWSLQVGFWPCDPKVPDIPNSRQRAAATLFGNSEFIKTKTCYFLVITLFDLTIFSQSWTQTKYCQIKSIIY
jgi:hypothetical protein